MGGAGNHICWNRLEYFWLSFVLKTNEQGIFQNVTLPAQGA